jgi:adenylate kinase family enzyme
MVAQTNCSNFNLDASSAPVIIFAGYSGSGKTTHCIPILKSLGYEILSSSVLIHGFSAKLIKLLTGNSDYNSYNRNLSILIDTALLCFYQDRSCEISNGHYEKKSRDFLIDLAEEVLVPTFSRSVFAHTIADQVNQKPSQPYAIEVYSQEEYEPIKRLIERDVFAFNLRRQSEDSSVDKRTLIKDARDIQNDGSYAELKQDLSILFDQKYY